MKSRTILLLLVVFLSYGMNSDKPAYQFFNAKGKKVKYKKVLKQSLEADIIFFGELHNNPICHWLQLELTQALFQEKGNKLVMGAEMFEADNQLIIDEYLNGQTAVRNFEQEAKLWPNYTTDYKPLIEFAKKNELGFVASNIPRRYAALVHKKGFEGLEMLSDEAQSYIAPLPVLYDPELPGYKGMLEMMSGMGHVNENLPKAQAIKDATMAHFILEYWDTGKTFIHFNGAYHSKNFEGIVWYLKQEKPDLNIITISAEEQASLDSLNTDYLNTAGFILVIPENMTKTY